MRERLIRWLHRNAATPVIVLDLGDFLRLARPNGVTSCRDSVGRVVHLRAVDGLSELTLHTAVRNARRGG